MKKTVLAMVMLTLSLATLAQVYKFKTFQTCVTQNGYTTAWKDVSMLVVINLDKSSLQIYSRETQDIDLTTLLSNASDDDNNKWLKYQGVDGDGIACLIKLKVFSDQSGRHCATLFLEYSDVVINYRLQRP